MDSGSLTAHSANQVAGMACSECHQYPLTDKNHFTHITYNAGVYLKQVNGFMTCLDCHSTSLQRTTQILYDSLFEDSAGAILSSVENAGSSQGLTGTLLRVDTLVQHHPMPTSGKVAPDGVPQEWITGLAHMNGKVDVVFDSTVTDLARFRGARAGFDPKLETCSAVSCHLHDGAYRFEACSKGFPELSGGPGPYYQCNEL